MFQKLQNVIYLLFRSPSDVLKIPLNNLYKLLLNKNPKNKFETNK